MHIGQWLAPLDVAHRPRAGDKRQALSLIADLATRSAPLQHGAVLERLTARETEGSTGVGHGVALPHARLPGLTRMRAIFVRLDQPVGFEAVDGQPVDLLFALLAPQEAGSEHLRALAQVSRLLREPNLREQLRLARSADALYALLAQEAQASAA